MKLSVGALSMLFLLEVTLGHPDLPQKIYKKIARHHLNVACWGRRNTMQYYKMVKKAQEKCMSLTPTFPIDIDFGSDQFQSRPTRIQGNFQGSSDQGLKDFRGSPSNNNPYDAWMAFLAFQQYQQQHQSNSAYSRSWRDNGRRRFQRGAHSSEEIAEFRQHLYDYKMSKKENMGNLTCVLADMGILDANLDINMKFYTRDAWTELEEPIDPDFRDHMIEAYEDCHTISQSIPQSLMDKHPIMEQFGRHFIFFKCAEKAERSMCAKQELLRFMEDLHEEQVTPQMLQELGLPQDKYEAALIATKVMHSAVQGPEKFVSKAIFGGFDD